MVKMIKFRSPIANKQIINTILDADFVPSKQNLLNDILYVPIFDDHPGAFGAERKYDIHTGVDLYCLDGSEVLSMTSGVVVGVEQFTGKDVGSDWWNTTYSVTVATDEYIGGNRLFLVYGEIDEFVEVGDKLEQGTIIGTVSAVLRKDKGRPQAMLHLESYLVPPGVPFQPVRIWNKGTAKPAQLCNPVLLFKDSYLEDEPLNLIVPELPPAPQINKPRLFIDMDGVTFDFEAGMHEAKLSAMEFKYQKGAYVNLKLVPGAKEAINALVKSGKYDVFFATKPPAHGIHSYSEKAESIRQHFPELVTKLIITCDKGLLGDERDFIIDDRPHKGNLGTFKGTLIVFDAANPLQAWETVKDLLLKETIDGNTQHI